MVGQAKHRTTKTRSNNVGGGISGCFFLNFDDCRPEVADDVISSMTVDKVTVAVPVIFGDSALNGPSYSTHCWLVPFYAYTRRIQLKFAADRKQIVTSCPMLP